MDETTRRDLEKLRADCLAMCDKSRELAEHVVEMIDAEITRDVVRGHRKPRHPYLTVVKGLITGAAAYAALRKFATVAAASAVTAAAVTVVSVPLVLRSPAPLSVPRRPAPARTVTASQHRGRRRVVTQRRSAPDIGTVTAASPSPAPKPSQSPGPLVTVSVSPSPGLPCLIRLLGICVP